MLLRVKLSGKHSGRRGLRHFCLDNQNSSDLTVNIISNNLKDLRENPLGVRIRRHITQAISDFELIADGDRVLVAVSGGKDSAVLLWQLLQIQRLAKVNFEIQPLILDQKQPGFTSEKFAAWVKHATGLDLIVLEEDTYSVVKEKTPEGKAFCRICSRLRRGILYTYAAEHGYNKIALGHHRDDLNQTLLLNMFYSGSIGSMPAKLVSDDGRNVVIRPLAYVPEDWIEQFAPQLQIPIIPCNLCGSQEGLKREKMKALLKSLETELHPNIGASLLNAQKNVRFSQLLGYNPNNVLTPAEVQSKPSDSGNTSAF